MKRTPLVRDALAARAPAWALGTCSVVVFYAAIRVVASWSGVEADARGIYWTEHAGFTWRLITALLFGALVTLTLAQLDPDRTERWLLPAIVIAALAIVLQAALLP